METLPTLAYSIEDAAKASGVGRTKLFELIKDGKLRARKVGRRTLITADDLKQMLDNLPVREAAE
jgi:excisionase family DNA binding protein